MNINNESMLSYTFQEKSEETPLLNENPPLVSVESEVGCTWTVNLCFGEMVAHSCGNESMEKLLGKIYILLF